MHASLPLQLAELHQKSVAPALTFFYGMGSKSRQQPYHNGACNIPAGTIAFYMASPPFRGIINHYGIKKYEHNNIIR